MSEQSKGLEKFIRQQVFRTRATPLERFSLRSAGAGSKGQEVDSFPIPSDFNGDNLGIMFDEICQRAQDDANGAGSKVHRYALIAIEQGASSGPRFQFRLRGESEDGDEEDGEEAPTEKGLLTQMMRHNETLMRMLVMTTGSAVNSMSRRLDHAEAANLELVKQRQEGLKILEAAKTEEHDREIQLMLVAGQEDRKGLLFKKLEMLMPIVMNKIAGKNVMPDGEAGDVFQKLADSLGPEQLQKIAPFLDQEQQMLLLVLLKEAREKTAKAASKKQEEAS